MEHLKELIDAVKIAENSIKRSLQEQQFVNSLIQFLDKAILLSWHGESSNGITSIGLVLAASTLKPHQPIITLGITTEYPAEFCIAISYRISGRTWNTYQGLPTSIVFCKQISANVIHNLSLVDFHNKAEMLNCISIIKIALKSAFPTRLFALK